MRTLILTFTLTSLLLGCGGASEQERDTAQGGSVSDQTNEEAQNADEADTPVQESWDIVAEEGFLFQASNTLSLNIDLPEFQNRRAYINLCQINEHNSINYQNCILKSPLRNGYFNKEVDIGNQIEHLALAIWPYTGEDPLVFQWERTAGLDWVIDNNTL